MADAVTVTDLVAWMREFGRMVKDQKEQLTALDAAIGDADHGTNMDRGITAVLAKLDEAKLSDPAALCKQVGMTLVGSVGGAAGPLFGTFFIRMAGALGDAPQVDAATFAAGVHAGAEGVIARGRAEPGDKTMCDALTPAAEALQARIAAGGGLPDALRSAHQAAETGRDATIPMLARKGRASYLGQRSVGHQDPGATTVAILFAAAVATLAAGG